MGGAVEREAALVPAGEVGLVGQHGAGVLGAAAAGERGGQLHFQMNEQRAGRVEQQVAGGGPLDGAAAQGQHQRVFGGQAGDGGVLEVAEGRLAVTCEDRSNGGAGLGLDHVIHIHKAPAEPAGHKRANGAFARAHEAGEDDAARCAGNRVLRIGLGVRQGLGGHGNRKRGIDGRFLFVQYREVERQGERNSAEHHHHGSGGNEQAAGQRGTRCANGSRWSTLDGAELGGAENRAAHGVRKIFAKSIHEQQMRAGEMNRRNRREFLKGTIAVAIGMSAPALAIASTSAGQGGSAGRNGSREDAPVVGNPILPGKGVCDPQIRVFNGRVYLYATHDASPHNPTYRMNDWWVWSSDDLVHWEQVSVLKPEQTFLRKPFTDCWATDAATRNGQFYFYFSAGPRQVGVVTGPTPAGPWRDPLGKPLIPADLSPTEARDPGILMDDDGAAYIIYGTWDYYIARLKDDMISLAEKPRLVQIEQKAGPYGQGKTDDKPFLHKRGGKYYLSWGCFYAMADSPYGPYAYKGSVVAPENTAPEFRCSHLFMDRHGSFFEFNGQWYYACNDYSQPGTSAYFRNSIFSYLHYRDNGEMAPVRIDRVGVGQYDASAGRIEAEDCFKLSGGVVRERAGGGFEVRELADRSVVSFPNTANVPARAKLIARLSNGGAGKGRLEVRADGAEGKAIGSAAIPSTGSWDHYADVEVPLHSSRSKLDLAFVFHGAGGELARFDSWRIVDRDRKRVDGPVEEPVEPIHGDSLARH